MSKLPPFCLANDGARSAASAAVWRAPEGWFVTIRPPTRSLDANAKFHALLNDIAMSKVPVCGEAGRPVDDLRTIFVSAWMTETGRPSSVVRGINSEPVQLRRSTTTFSVAEMSELIELTTAWAVQHEVKLQQ